MTIEKSAAYWSEAKTESENLTRRIQRVATYGELAIDGCSHNGESVEQLIASISKRVSLASINGGYLGIGECDCEQTMIEQLNTIVGLAEDVSATAHRVAELVQSGRQLINADEKITPLLDSIDQINNAPAAFTFIVQHQNNDGTFTRNVESGVIADSSGTYEAEGVAEYLSREQPLISGPHWRVCVWEGSHPDPGTDPDAIVQRGSSQHWDSPEMAIDHDDCHEFRMFDGSKRHVPAPFSNEDPYAAIYTWIIESRNGDGPYRPLGGRISGEHYQTFVDTDGEYADAQQFARWVVADLFTEGSAEWRVRVWEGAQPDLAAPPHTELHRDDVADSR